MNRNIKLIIEYDGSRYHGWQRQKGKVTIQSVLEECISKITSEKNRLISAGRTDAGVHSLGQVATFRTDTSHAPHVFKRALNSLLPPDIRIIDASEVAPDFHPRFSAKAKSYLYFICIEERPPVFIANYCWPVKKTLDLEAMKEASLHIVGTHDFSGFRASGCGARTKVRTIYELKIETQKRIPFLGTEFENEFIVIRVTGNAFLRYMVRNIVGTLVETGMGKRPAHSIKQILEQADRRLAGITAPAKGLFLERVYY